MSFLARLFSSDYRAGLGAEAVGDLLEAARRFAACERHGDLARVLRLRVVEVEDGREAVALARRALTYAERADVDLREYRACLAEALAQLAERSDPAGRRPVLREFALLCMELGWPARAGEALEQIDEPEAAADAYAKAGDVEAMERALGTFRARSMATVSLKGLAARVEALVADGRADEAWGAAEQGTDASVREALAARLCTAHVVNLSGPGGRVRLCSLPQVQVGREEGLGLTVRVPSVSRRHVSLSRDGRGLLLTDLGSAAGTLRGTLYLKEPLHLVQAATVWLGPRCELHLTPKHGTWRAQGYVEGCAGDTLYLGDYAAIDGVVWTATDRWWRADGRVVLVGDTVGLWTVGS